MFNVIQLPRSPRLLTDDQRQACLIRSFAQNRRLGDDVFWLKENAELLITLVSVGARPSVADLTPLLGFYEQVAGRLVFFRQYYRFLLSITLDLETLGVGNAIGEELVNWCADQELANAELSDLQRLEARRLMLRRGRDPLPDDKGLEDRVRDFIARPGIFALPNKKAAYELTHAVFYLSNYGERDPLIDQKTLLSLDFAGTLAFLELNADLLSEICVAMRFAGVKAPPIWEDWLQGVTRDFHVSQEPPAQMQDDYHEYLMCNWHQALCGARAFAGGVGFETAGYFARPRATGTLRQLSKQLLNMAGRRSADWEYMKPRLQQDLTQDELAVLELAEAATPNFGAFFEGFARTGTAA